MELAKAYLISMAVVQIAYVMYPRMSGLHSVLTKLFLVGAAAGLLFDLAKTVMQRTSRR